MIILFKMKIVTTLSYFRKKIRQQNIEWQ